jgi:CRP/FNR family transcriptional regulator, cyclic AMP receptor protein
VAIDLAGVLGDVPLFGGLTKRQLRRLARGTAVYEYEPGAALVKEGSQGHTLFVILEGNAKVVRRGRTIRRLGAREVFGEVAVLDHRPRSASVVAETPVRCVALHRDELRAMVEEEPRVAWHLLETLAERLRSD